MRLNIMMLLLLTTFVSVIATVPVHAEIEVQTYQASLDFSVYTPQTSQTCACAVTSDYVTVSNTGSFSAIFYLTSDLQLSESQFELAPGESRQVGVFIQNDCGPGTKTYTITVRSNLGIEKTVQKEVDAERCQNLELWVSPSEDIKACQNAPFQLFVKNVGSFPEDYSLDSNSDKYMSYTSNYFSLLPGQTAEINATLNLPCDFSGLKTVVFNAHAIKNKLDAQIMSSVNVLSDYAFDFTVDGYESNDTAYRQGLDVCNRVYSTDIPVTVVNYGIDNTFQLQTNKLPGFARIEGIDDSQFKFSLKRGETKTFHIIVDSHNFRYETKGYDFSLIIKPEIGDSIEKNFRINLQPCYEQKLIISDVSSEKKPIDVCAEGLYEYDVQLDNNGIYTGDYKLSLAGAPANVELSSYTATLEAGKSRQLKLYIIGPETNYLYDIKVIATLPNGLAASDDIWIQAHDKQTCHKLVFTRSNYRINYQTPYITVPVKNLGLQADYYDLTLNDTSLLTLDHEREFLNSSSTIRINIDSYNMSEGTYDVLLTATHVSGATYTDDLKVTLKDKSPLTKAFEYFFFGTQCRQITFWQIIAILIACILIIIFMVVGPHYKYKLSNRIRQKLPILLSLIAIFIVAVVLVFVLADRPKTTNEVYGLNTSLQDLRFETLENGNYVLDASQFFYDPDNNTLSYSVSDMKDVKVQVKGSIITFTPDLGWYGARIFTITAYDNQGGSITSPDMTLKVLNVPRKTFMQLYNIYCWYANLLVLLVLLALVFMIFVIKQKVRRRK